MDKVVNLLSLMPDPNNPFARAEEFLNYFPGSNKVPDGGAWVMVTRPPPTEYTIPPLSFWFAEPWPMDTDIEPHRVKVLTPKGELGLFPREYSLVEHPEKYFEFVGEGIEAKFFGNEEGIPKDALFYIRSRGISKKDAIVMLIGQIRAHGVLWLESSRELAEHFGMDWPAENRLATV